MKLLVLVLITLFLSVPSYSQQKTEQDYKTSKEIMLKGDVLGYGSHTQKGVGGLQYLQMAVKYKEQLFSCWLFGNGEPKCSSYE